MNVHYILTQMGPVEVDDLLDEGYKIIGRYKLLSPHPRLITSTDAQYILNKINEWLMVSYPQKTFSIALQDFNSSIIMNNIKYQFTLLYYGKIIEGDFYCLKLQSDDKEFFNVYIAKALCDNETYDDTEECLVYPFFTEMWHQTIMNPKPYKPGELW